MVKSAQPGEGGGCTPSPFHSIYHHEQNGGVYAPAEIHSPYCAHPPPFTLSTITSKMVGYTLQLRYTPPISPLPLSVLCVYCRLYTSGGSFRRGPPVYIGWMEPCPSCVAWRAGMAILRWAGLAESRVRLKHPLFSGRGGVLFMPPAHHSNSSLFDEDPGIMSEADTSSTRYKKRIKGRVRRDWRQKLFRSNSSRRSFWQICRPPTAQKSTSFILHIRILLPGRWVAKLVARLLAMGRSLVRIQTSPKNTKWAT